MERLSCNGRVFNCSTAAVVDPDVAGPGVVASFLATAFMAFLAIVVAYITDALPDNRLNRVDRTVIRRLRLLLRLKAFPESLDPVERRRKEIRKESLQRFVLALSDQQLVTGLAICVAGWAKCDISTYSFNIVSALAWFSCTTHLSTLTVLHDYFHAHPRLRLWRVIGMTLSVLGLLAAQLASFNGHLSSTSLFYCAVSRGFYIELFNERLNFNRLIVVFGWLGYAFGSRLVGLYSKDQTVYTKSWLYRKCMSLLDQPVDAVPMHEHIADTSRKILEGRRSSSSFRRKLSRFAMRHDVTFDDFSSSFLWEISALAFGLTYGIGQTIVVREQLSSTIKKNAYAEGLNVMGFGQIVAVMLLLLPILMAGEMHQELQQKHKRFGEAIGPQQPPSHGSSATLVNSDGSSRLDKDGHQRMKVSIDLHRVQSISLPSLPSMTAKVPLHAKEWVLSAAARSDTSDTCDGKLEAGLANILTRTHPYSAGLAPSQVATPRPAGSKAGPARRSAAPEQELYRTTLGRIHLWWIIINHFMGIFAAAIVLSIVLPNLQALLFLYQQLLMMFWRPIYRFVLEARDIFLALVRFAFRRCRGFARVFKPQF